MPADSSKTEHALSRSPQRSSASFLHYFAPPTQRRISIRTWGGLRSRIDALRDGMLFKKVEVLRRGNGPGNSRAGRGNRNG